MDNKTEKIENLIIDYLTGSISEAELDELIDWKNQSKENQQIFDDFRQAWLALKIHTEEKKFNTEMAFNKFQTQVIQNEISEKNTSGIFKKIKISVLQAAAIILALISLGIGFVYITNNLNENENQKFTNQTIVPLGSKSQVILPDGSLVTLNAGSKLTYDISTFNKKRHVRLEGEAYFKVHSDKKNPFVVNAEGISVKATGTEFNVKAYPEDKIIETILVEGTVNIGDEKLINKPEKLVTLKPNEIFVLDKENNISCVDTKDKQLIGTEINLPILKKKEGINLKYIKTDVDPKALISWKEKHWKIHREPLGQLAIKLERKYAVKIIFSEEELKKFRFNGTLEDESLEQVLNAMSLTSPIKYKIEGKNVLFFENKNLKEESKNLYIAN